MAIIEIEKPSLHPASLTLHDIVVGRGSRGQGVGRQLFDWVSARCESERIDRIFLESGIRNTQAHAIFENLGFRKTAVMMMKEIALRP